MANTRKVIDTFHGEFDFLSNFAEAEVTYGPYTFPRVENAYQFAKLPKNMITIEVFRKFSQATAAGSKHFGKALSQAEGLFRSDWEQIKVKVMRHLLDQKFAIPELRRKLLATGDAELIEGNLHHDNEWGDCHCNQVRMDERKYGKKRNCMVTGRNLLGNMLMEIRDELAYNDPFRCPHCLSKDGLAQLDVLEFCQSQGHFEGDQFVFDGNTVIDWNAQKSMFNPPKYYCSKCDFLFQIKKGKVPDVIPG